MAGRMSEYVSVQPKGTLCPDGPPKGRLSFFAVEEGDLIDGSERVDELVAEAVNQRAPALDGRYSGSGAASRNASSATSSSA